MADSSSSNSTNSNAPNPVEEQVHALDVEIGRLKVLYEQYFLGRERMAPQTLRQEVDRALQQLLGGMVNVNNTGTRFRIKSLQSKLISLRRYWDRTIQQIEDGTYKRDRFKLKLHTRDQDEKPKPGATPAKAPPAAEAKAAAAKNNPIEALMKQFVDAKQKCNENVGGITYDAFAKSISSQSAALKKQYKCKSVRFKVVIENGKTKLKATPV